MSKTVIEALDKISSAIKGGGGIEHPLLRTGDFEHILAFNTNEHHVLNVTDPKHPFFSNTGVITDLQGVELPGSKIQTSLRIEDLTKFPTLYEWPDPQPPPFNEPPSIPAKTEPLGFSKQFYRFPDGSELVTTGPSVPKIQILKDGGSHLWVASVGVIAQGKGKYEGARGLSSYVGSAYFPKWPDPKDVPAQINILVAGFPVKSSAFFKFVLKKDQV